MNIIQIKDSSEKGNLELFFEVARNVYKNDKIWSPSSDEIFLQRYKSYEQKKDVSISPIVLMEDNIPCARAVAISKNNLTSSKGKKQGWISYFDISKEYQSYANSFLEYTENILMERGIESILIPRFDNSIAGLQISKFELPHTFLSTYNLPFYYDIFQKQTRARIYQ